MGHQEKCFKCGVSGEKSLLLDVILNKGIFKICRRCSFKENSPIVKKPLFSAYPGNVKGRTSVYERLSKIAGINPVEHKEKISKIENEKALKYEKNQENDLKEIADKNFVDGFQIKQNSRKEFIDNFHWIITRARRAKKLTQKQLAETIKESETAVKIAEQGIIQENSDLFMNKLENFLGIKLLKESSFKQEELIEKNPEGFKFDTANTKSLTISDLKEIKEKRESDILGFLKENNKADEEGKKEIADIRSEKDLGEVKEGGNEGSESGDLTYEEIDKILYGKS